MRLSERWFNRGLWLVAIAFAAFLAGLGGTVVSDLPKVEQGLEREAFLDQATVEPLRETMAGATRAAAAIDGDLDQVLLRLEAVQQAYDSGRQSFKTWVDARTATGLASQDTELIARARDLDQRKEERDQVQRSVDALQQRKLAADQERMAAAGRLGELEALADRQMSAAQDRADLRVFLYRLAITLPLLGIAGWLLLRKRGSTWWPFIWGFALFALYAFFVELVPYLPSYGGYVRYAVGIVVTVVVGRAVIVALNRYLLQMKLAEQQPEQLRRKTFAYDTALLLLAKGACPSCERKVDLVHVENDFCPHCGIGLFDHCGACARRKSAFAQFCHGCGAPAHAPETNAIVGQP
jgi:hypothetical protein